MDVTSPAPLHPSDRLRREPTAPVVFLLVLAAIPYLTGSLIVQVPGLQRAAVRFAQSPTRLLTAGSVLAAVTAVLVLGDLLRTRQPPPLRLALRIVRSLAYASLLTAALYLAVLSQQRAAPGWMPSAWKAEAFWVTAFVLLSGAVYALALHPWGDPGSRRSVLTPYQNVVASLRDTYDFVLGIGYPDDELRAASGRKAWALLPHQALWTNLFVFGGVGSGKTSRNAYPLVQQAIGKHPQNDALRPSIVMLDLKGDNAEQVYRFAKQLGRAEEFWCIAPGNALPQENGRDIIPTDRFLTWNPVGGTDASDIRALQLYDAFEATNEAPSHQYFKDVQSEFLTSTIQLFDVVDGVGKVTLLDLYKFGLDASTRANLIAEARNLPSLEAKGAVAYFDGKFNQLPPKDQSALISGLTAKLAKLSSPTLQSTFCQPDGGENAFTSFHELVVNHPGIVVFSVPDSLYSEELSRLLGIAFLRRFQTQQLERSTTAFRARGGNVDRLVLNVVDECWAYMNAKIASFTAVSRQSKTCCLFLSQSLDQIGEQYRETVIGNFRSKVLLGVNDLLTLKTFSAVFGEEERDVEVESVGESLQQVRQGVLGDVDARSRGMTASRSIQKRTMPRYSLTDLQELGGGRGVFHLFDGQDQHKPRTIEFCPWYRLPYFLFHPLAHPDVHCRQGGPRALHDYVPDEHAFICATCGHQIDDKTTNDLQDYQANHPELLSGLLP